MHKIPELEIASGDCPNSVTGHHKFDGYPKTTATCNYCGEFQAIVRYKQEVEMIIKVLMDRAYTIWNGFEEHVNKTVV